MFDELAKYKNKGNFVFKSTDDLKQACNAPTDKSGVYLVYALKKGNIELVYIGRSGQIKDGAMFVRKAGLGGMKDRLVNGHRFGKIPRRLSWPEQLKTEGIEALDIYWYVTHEGRYIDCPKVVENTILGTFFEVYGRLPNWNNEL